MSEEVASDLMSPRQEKREAQRAQANRDELVERVLRAVREDGSIEPLEGVCLHHQFKAVTALALLAGSEAVTTPGGTPTDAWRGS